MRKIILLLTLVLFASCAKETEKDRVEDAFMHYIKTEFDDTREFKKITSIEPFDTISASDAIELYDKAYLSKSMMLKDDLNKLNEYEKRLKKDTTQIITYKVNTILKSYDKQYTVAFYVIKDGNSYKVQDHEVSFEELPDLLHESITFLREAIFRAQAKQILGW